MSKEKAPKSPKAKTKSPGTKKKASKKKTAAKKKTAKKATKEKASAPKDQKKTSSDNAESIRRDPTSFNTGFFDTDLFPNSDEFTRNLARATELSQRIAGEYFDNPEPLKPMADSIGDPLHVGEAFSELVAQMAMNPEHLIQAQNNLWQGHFGLWQNFAQRALGGTVDPFVQPSKGDKRFRDKEWDQNQIFDLIKQSYLVTANWLQDTVDSVEGLDEETRVKVSFYTKQITDAFAPTNYLMTNPEVLRATIDSQGENLVKGLEHMLEDLEEGKGKLAIKQVDTDYFEVGRNLATTPGKVVYEGELFQLLQFSPTTEQVYERPLVIFPPWINKYYILDLREDNSFIKWMTDQGYTVFVVSWVNPTGDQGDKTFEDYMHQGVYEALDAVEQAAGINEFHTIGYCIGGTLLGCTLAHMAANDDDRIKSATFFTAQLDFEEAGELRVFVDEEQLKSLEDRMTKAHGVLEASDMAQTFNMLRSNDLIWSFVINNYLLGKDPIRFDLLYWNSDSTRMAKGVHIYYLRTFYLYNKLAKGELELGGELLDMSKVKTPVFLQSSRDDHIAPHRSIWRTRNLFTNNDDVEFMCAGSGHIAGVINPPDAHKYQYWTNTDDAETLSEWWEGAEEHPGSWWPYWEKWLRAKSGKQIPARVPGDGKLKVIEDAPGSYVKVRS